MLFLQLNLSSEDSEGVAAEKDWNEKNKKEKKCTHQTRHLNGLSPPLPLSREGTVRCVFGKYAAP